MSADPTRTAPTTPEGAFVAALYDRITRHPPHHRHRDTLATVVACIDRLGDPASTRAYRSAHADCAAELLREVAPDLLLQFLDLTFSGAV